MILLYTEEVIGELKVRAIQLKCAGREDHPPQIWGWWCLIKKFWGREGLVGKGGRSFPPAHLYWNSPK